MRPGLLVLKFGAVDYAATRAAGSLAPVASQVREGVPVTVVVLDPVAGASQTLTMTPSRWQGNGLLGCFLVPTMS